MSTNTDRCACCTKTEYVVYLNQSSRYWCRQCEMEFEIVYNQRKCRAQLNLPLQILLGRSPP